jgi:hypothetical protein
MEIANMSEKLAFTELVHFYHSASLLGTQYGADEDLELAENRYWIQTGRWLDNKMLMPTFWKGCALDGFCPHRGAEYASRMMMGEWAQYHRCGDCGAVIGDIGYDLPRGTNDRNESTAIMAELEF